MAATQPSNTPGHKVPDGNTTIVTANGQQSSSTIEGTGECLTTRVKDAVIMLSVRMKEKW